MPWHKIQKIELSEYDDETYNLHVENNHNYFANDMMVSNCHSAQASVLCNLIEQATNTTIRHGLTGTLQDSECNQQMIKGLLGPDKRIVTSKEIIDEGKASPISIKMTMLNHNVNNCESFYNASRKLLPKNRYNHEVEYINALEQRREVIQGIIDSLEGNTLVLFDRVEEYGKEMYENCIEQNPDNTFLLTGDVKEDERENVRLGMEDRNNSVIWASYGVAQTGLSIKKLHNLVLISSSKSKIRVLQSIGRLMRLHSTKEQANIIDIVDNLTYKDNTTPNYMLKHAQKRLDYYLAEQFKVDFINLDL